MENLIETVEKFLAYSDEKLEELAEKNHALKLMDTDDERE